MSQTYIYLPNPGMEPGSPASQADSLPSEPPRKPQNLSKTLFRNSLTALRALSVKEARVGKDTVSVSSSAFGGLCQRSHFSDSADLAGKSTDFGGRYLMMGRLPVSVYLPVRVHARAHARTHTHTHVCIHVGHRGVLSAYSLSLHSKL